MRHRKAVLKLNRTASHRNAMFRNMVTSLFKYERIQTTGAKAKELRRWADHLITLAKRGDLHARRQALAIVREKDVVHKLFEHAAVRYGSVSGGYTRIVKLGRRPGDAAPVSLVELIYSQDTKKKKTRKKKTKADAAPKTAAAADKPAADEEKKKPAKTSEKKAKAKPKEDKAKSAASKPSKKKAAGDAKEEKPATKAAPKKKATAKDKPAAEAKPKKKAKAEAPEDAADDTKKKKASAKKSAKDEK